ncbi:5-methyltetrahydropteroyltriglutamate--homocysteine S-methyltransferase [Sphingomonas sanxanigenens]|uniref:5-methyltetrahydropteroyltriglutamate--homocysteine methyltransferase n=1 Tax=Sphingomonas sanxanigenens DSM 19645 = NX02 TaxID=1123269 RepID=W0AG65_9SPHN|nr:5-methyltetrahydropteroyltriglutamate--homocysteine S-methyltransferase [Sphingomonas sanxanigenens]AHE54650.1 5-methyltetrahydropteroyltriglutamate--homocysteine methyltransferase [Sphingomonas sanxanigenens DSM 19645 = NX02]
MTVTVATLGFPRIGPRRELKFALEKYWAGKIGEAELREAAAGLRTAAWARQKALGTDWLPSNDFSLYDHVLDLSVMLGAIPGRYRAAADGPADLGTYFAMARGKTGAGDGCGHAHGSVTAGEMTKWFDTNYHYIVPEIEPGQTLALGRLKIVEDYREAKAQGYETRPVLLGPVTWLSLAKGHGVDPFDRLDDVLALYADILRGLAQAGAAWVQIDEPILVTDLSERQRLAFTRAYARLARTGPRLMLTTYFGGLEDNLSLAAALPVAGLHVDLVRAPEQLDAVLKAAPKGLLLSLGIIDGRNVWRADLDALLARLEPVAATRDLILAPSCSLLHVPIDLALEPKLDEEIRQWLAFAVQKIAELDLLRRALNDGRASVAEPLATAARAAAERKTSPRIHDAGVQARLAAVTPAMRDRQGSRAERSRVQAEVLGLPPFPTTTIGSFPQTADVRHARAEHGRGHLDDAGYEQFLREETARAIRWQEEVGLDMLVHGEFERNDMVQYFGEQLSGFAFTIHGWVQSYGSRCVRPPILYGDVSRPAPMTVEWWLYAQSLTDRPVKGMLTGPVTILNWSFVRDDQPRAASCRQIALAIRDEVADLERAGCRAIQIDEAALREGMPLRRRDGQPYLDWAVDAFRLSAAGVADATQIHTHMCYSEFNEILPAIGAMDADVISIETARSQMALLEGFARYRYPGEIGPGVYDIHSARVPTEAEMVALMRLAQHHLRPEQLWINPDCGLKTRRWEEVRPAIAAMVAAARRLRGRG